MIQSVGFTHGSLFSGIGGFDLAAQWMGWQNKFHCEWNPFGQKILKHYWPQATSYHDITKTDFTIWRHKIDILTGGFPCQPYSTAGKRKGKADERHLWPEMLRAIREIKPTYVVGENVGGIVSWNGGMVFEEVQAELEAQGYQVQPFLLPAAGVSAPHRRDRVWFIAYSHHNRAMRTPRRYESQSRKEWVQKRNEVQQSALTGSARRYVTHTKCLRRSQDYRQRKSRQPHQKSSPRDWQNFPTQSPICNGNDGLSTRLDLDTVFQVFTKKLTRAKWRNESIKGGGNAIVPQVALQIFKAIAETHNMIITEK